MNKSNGGSKIKTLKAVSCQEKYRSKCFLTFTIQMNKNKHFK